VTTPQRVALSDLRRSADLWNQAGVPLLGLVENMSYYECGSCGERENLFGVGGGEAIADEYGIDVLGA
jgi:ATP-binding protein involved in chromosome partitioning